MNFEEKYAYMDDFIRQKIVHHETEWKNYRKVNRLLIFSGILFSASVTIAGIFGEALLAALLSVFTGLTITVQNAFNYSENIAFHGSMLAQYTRLYTNLKVEVNSEKELIKLQDFLEIYLMFEGKNQVIDDEIRNAIKLDEDGKVKQHGEADEPPAKPDKPMHEVEGDALPRKIHS